MNPVAELMERADVARIAGCLRRHSPRRDDTPDDRRAVEAAVKYCPTHALKIVEET